MPHIALTEGAPGILGPMLRGPNSLSRAERELIAMYVSSQNDCFFCQTIHGAVAAHHLQGDETVGAETKRAPEKAAISAKLKTLLAIAAKVQKGGKHLKPNDSERAKRN